MRGMESELDAMKQEVAKAAAAAVVYEERMRILKAERDALLSPHAFPPLPHTPLPPSSLPPAGHVAEKGKSKWKGMEGVFAASAWHEEAAEKTKEFQKSLFLRSERVDTLLHRVTHRVTHTLDGEGESSSSRPKGQDDRIR
jgi:hypothetical protein